MSGSSLELRSRPAHRPEMLENSQDGARGSLLRDGARERAEDAGEASELRADVREFAGIALLVGLLRDDVAG
eukprot:2397033-Alexandrium_andersonii.AAC.1